jgi:hypothetical protein
MEKIINFSLAKIIVIGYIYPLSIKRIFITGYSIVQNLWINPEKIEPFMTKIRSL